MFQGPLVHVVMCLPEEEKLKEKKKADLPSEAAWSRQFPSPLVARGSRLWQPGLTRVHQLSLPAGTEQQGASDGAPHTQRTAFFGLSQEPEYRTLSFPKGSLNGCLSLTNTHWQRDFAHGIAFAMYCVLRSLELDIYN